jgi:ribosome-associated toxin RatA of RatAB toxin-antitoxin module
LPHVVKSVLVDRPAAELFALVDECERYPQFLPWCSGAQVFERTAQVTRARLDIDYHGLKTHITTRNSKQPPESIVLAMEEGPFETFSANWHFTPLGDAGCRVELVVDYEFAAATLAGLLRPALAQIVETLMERFVARAQSQ